MSVSVLYTSMSLDGHIAGPNDEPGNPGGDGFDRLHEWFGSGSDGQSAQLDGPARRLIDEYETTGAVLAGRRTVNRSITMAVIITVYRSSCPVTGHPIPRSRTIRW